MDLHELFSQPHALSIALPSQEQGEDVRHALVLFCALKKLGKNVSLEHQAAQSMAHTSPAGDQVFAVSIKGVAPWVSQVYYEKNARDLDLYFTVQEGKTPEQPHITLKNTSHPTIIAENNNGEKGVSSIQASSDLAKAALDHLSHEGNPTTLLLIRALSRIEYILEAQTYIVSLSREDFEKAGAVSKNSQGIIQDLKNSFGDSCSYLLLFESPASEDTQVLFWSPDRKLQDAIMLYGVGEGRGNWVLFSASDMSPIKLREVLKSILLREARL